MNQDSDNLDFKIDLGNPNQKGYGATNDQNRAAQYQDNTSQGNVQGGGNNRAAGLLSCFSVEFYQPFFDVTTEDVKTRIKASIDPRSKTFFDTIRGRPDLYGPFWIYTTLIFALAACGNFSSFIVASSAGATFKSHFNYVPIATSVIYGFGTIVPIVLCFLLRLFGSQVHYTETLCIYGYASFITIPALVLCIFPFSILQWIVLMVALASSTWFLLNNYAHELSKYVGNQRFILYGLIGGSQCILLLIFRLKFFGEVYSSDS